ncbi:hypothetical protein Tco_0951805 [Tanacetum coccineum]|uniref:Uncharacterized protein n=1 Tax=Tanacetum coccineum TaxID=301880 RepID=A0ABQ5DVK1_9ASTR
MEQVWIIRNLGLSFEDQQWRKMGRMGRNALELLEQRFSTIMGYRKKMWSGSEKDVELLPPSKGARHAYKLLWKQGGESPWCLVAKSSFKMGQIAKK